MHYDVRYSREGCSVELELLPNCLAPGEYAFEPQPVTEFKVIHNDSQAAAELPLGAAAIQAQIKGDRAFRVDYMYAGIDSLPADAHYSRADLRGKGCERATHVIKQLYLGGFAWAFGESSALDGSASLFTASVGGGTHASVKNVHTEGSQGACQKAQESSTLNNGCKTPLHAVLLPLDGVLRDRCTDLASCSTRCDGDEPESCFELGTFYLLGKQVTKDAPRGLQLLDKACQGGSVDACTVLGTAYRTGSDVDKNLATALQLFSIGCQGGRQVACLELGNMFETGDGVAADSTRAIGHYQAACRAGSVDGCQRAMPLLERDCKAGRAEACRLLGDTYAFGTGVAINEGCKPGSSINARAIWATARAVLSWAISSRAAPASAPTPPLPRRFSTRRAKTTLPKDASSLESCPSRETAFGRTRAAP